MRPTIAAIVCLLTAGAAFGQTNDCCGPESPFRLGEAYAQQPASCETLRRWADAAPDIEGRVTMTARGELAAVETDGTLAYLVMCEEPGTQVMCVTYETNGMQPGETVLFAGGYARVGEAQVMLDPCLATRE